MKDNVYVEVVRDKDKAVVKRLGPMSAWKADKVEGGLSINLNHNDYSTRIVEGTAA